MKAIRPVLYLIIACAFLMPLYLMVIVAFKPVDELSSVWFLPSTWYLENFVNAWTHANLASAFTNNVVITVVSVLLIVVFGAMASYPLARFKTRLNHFLYLAFVACMIVPPLTTLVPLYGMLVQTIGTSNYGAIILPHLAYQLPLTIMLFTAFIATIPRELDEAATIDGCGKMELFFRILLPTLKPVTATVVIMTSRAIWNDYTFSVFFLQKPEIQNMTVALSGFFNQFGSKTAWVAAGCLFSLIPFSLLYFFLQKYFIKGITAGAVKG